MSLQKQSAIALGAKSDLAGAKAQAHIAAFSA
jgi:hypothetical protein